MENVLKFTNSLCEIKQMESEVKKRYKDGKTKVLFCILIPLLLRIISPLHGNIIWNCVIAGMLVVECILIIPPKSMYNRWCDEIFKQERQLDKIYCLQKAYEEKKITGIRSDLYDPYRPGLYYRKENVLDEIFFPVDRIETGSVTTPEVHISAESVIGIIPAGMKKKERTWKK